MKGNEDLVEAPEAEAETTVVDLMTALKASVARAKEEEKKVGRSSKSDKSKTARKKAS